MGNTENIEKRIRQSSCLSTNAAYNKISSQNSLNDLDNKVSSGIFNDDLTQEEKFELNKKKLNLLPQFADLEYKIKYFNQKALPSQGQARESFLMDIEKNKSNRYEGTFKGDKLYGQGIYFYPTGSIYKGGIKDNGRDGEGVFYFGNGNIYSGGWESNDQNGLGKFFFAQGGKLFQFYYGQFEFSLYGGFGCYCYQNKYYIGFWKNDKYEGNGKVVSFDGKVLKCGLFADDKLVTEIPENELKFPSNWDQFLPNFTKEAQLYRDLQDCKPIL